MKILPLLLALLFFSAARSAEVDTVTIYSKSMNKARKCVVIRPFIPQQRPIPLPTVYLLHGYSGDYSNWITKVPQLRELADQYQMIIVCPDGEFSSWYINSPIDPSMKYETYITEEVPAFIDSAYLTIKDRSKRAITGLSMGGHGALYLGFRHAKTFGACGSMSGGVDLKSSIFKFDLSKRIGDTIHHAKNWDTYSVINIIEKKPEDSLAIIFDCGINDFFSPDNKRLHEKMLKLKIAHDYIERPGNHSWPYWANAIQYQLLFFRTYFNSPKK
jgi:S-formylglutathione hydrolase FrmB